MPFLKGQSGNPGGKPKGIRQKQSKYIKGCLVPCLDEAIKNIVEAVKKGDIKSSALVINAILNIERVNIKPASHTAVNSKND